MSRLVETEYAKKLVAQLSHRLHRRRAIPSWEQDDYTQELSLRLLQAERRFEAQRGARDAYVTIVLRRCFHQLLRDQQAAKRRTEVVSLNVQDDDPTDWHHEFDEFALRHDVAVVLVSMADSLRELAEQLKRERLAEIARQRGVPRSTLQNRVRELRDAFEKYQLRGS